jgi:hypothetical protein
MVAEAAVVADLVLQIHDKSVINKRSTVLGPIRIFITRTTNNFPEFLYTLIFQIEYKILLRNS